MRQETITLYQYSELSEQAQEKAIEAYRAQDYFIDSDWYESTIENCFPEVLKEHGLSFDNKCFFDTDRDYYITFEGLHIEDLSLLLKRSDIKPVKSHIFDLVSDYIRIDFTRKHSEQSFTNDFISGDRCPLINSKLDRIIEACNSTLQDIKHDCLTTLRNELEYMYTEEHAIECITCHELEFKADGSIY